MILLLLACATPAPAPDAAAPASDPAVTSIGPTRTLTFAAYAAARDAYDHVLPSFSARWKAQTGEELRFEASYVASGAQARAVKEGLEADVVALSLAPDVKTVADAGLITHDWEAGAFHGVASQSIVVIAVRPGNPEAIHDWIDLTRSDVEVLTPNVRTSGGAMWNVLAVWGAGQRARKDGARQLTDVLRRVTVMDKSGRDSIVTFEKGVGDAAITYEHEVLTARAEGRAMDYVVPTSTLLIENPIAVVDTYVDRHGNRDAATAFVAFVQSEEGQRLLGQQGLRSPEPAWNAADRPVPADLFTVRDLGGWPTLTADVFGKGAAYDQAVDAAKLAGR